MEIDYQLLQDRIFNMVTKEFATDTTNVVTITKKGQSIIASASAYILELESEIENLKRKSQEDIANLKRKSQEELANLKAELTEVKKENSKLKEENSELTRVANAKQLQKQYIKEVENQLDRLPAVSRKNEHKKAQLVKYFVDWSLSIFAEFEKLPLKTSARFSYTERNLLILSILGRIFEVVVSDLDAVQEHLKKKFPDGLEGNVVEIGEYSLKNLDDFVNFYSESNPS